MSKSIKINVSLMIDKRTTFNVNKLDNTVIPFQTRRKIIPKKKRHKTPKNREIL